MSPIFMNRNDLSAILKHVQKPSQYLGNEVNAVHKDFNKCQVRVALIFPDAYEMGMSHTGLKILYKILNDMEGVVAERCFAPLLDMEAKLRDKNIPLFSLESKTPLKEFDIIGISLPYELVYTNTLNIIDLAQIPVWQKDRKERDPIILAGGTQSYNPEPMADFLDAVAIGDGEELIKDVVNQVICWKQNKKLGGRNALLENLTSVQGLYVPKFFQPIYHDDGTILEVKPLKKDYPSVQKRIVENLDAQPYPTSPVVPNIKLIHDRIGIEIQRGCTRMCRFCQAGYIERPTRQRDPQTVLKIADESLNNTGIDEISLLSLSAGDYNTIVPTLKELNGKYRDQKISISVPATRTETLTPEMIEQIKQVRMTGFTIAPEAGSARMRRVINKGNKVEDLLQACRNAFSAGYKLIKFYYMCGLPFETDEDVANIANEALQALNIGFEYTRDLKINVSVSSFVPKPFTPFQWEPQMTIEETKRKHQLIKSNLKNRKLVFKHHDAEMSFLEGLFARGDRRLSKLIYQAFKNGCRFDEWSEHFNFSKWQQSIQETDVDLHFYLHRRRNRDEIFPWDHLFSQMKKDWLWKEYEAAKNEAFIADCSIEKCAAFCGVCDFKTIKNKIYVIDDKPLAAKKGNREWYGRFGNPDQIPSPTKKPALDHQENPENHFKLRVKFSKTDLAAMIGHLELMNLLKRAILRNKFPVAYSQGYHPQMKLAMGFALPLGVESTCEYLDVTFKEHIKPIEFIDKMNKSLPQGLTVIKAEYVDLRAPSIYSITKSVDYQLQFSDLVPDQTIKGFSSNLKDLQKGTEFYYLRRRPKGRKREKSISINKYINAVQNFNDKDFNLTILCDENGSIKPTEVVSALSKITQDQLANIRVRKVGVSLAN